MNPRGDGATAHWRTRRAAARCFAAACPRGATHGVDRKAAHGFVGHFFCASIEDQFEHLVGQWGDRVPLGSADRGGARDPLIGAHEHGDGAFEVPQAPRRRRSR